VTVLALSQTSLVSCPGDAAFRVARADRRCGGDERDVLGLLLSFDPPRDEGTAARPELSPEQAEEFVGILRARRSWLQTASRAGRTRWLRCSPVFPRIPRAAVFERGDK